MGSPIALPRPEGTLRFDQIFGPGVRSWIDGQSVELNRVEVHFPNEEIKLNSVARLVKEAINSREEAVKFLLDVIDQFQAA